METYRIKRIKRSKINIKEVLSYILLVSGLTIIIGAFISAFIVTYS